MPLFLITISIQLFKIISTYWTLTDWKGQLNWTYAWQRTSKTGCCHTVAGYNIYGQCILSPSDMSILLNCKTIHCWTLIFCCICKNVSHTAVRMINYSEIQPAWFLFTHTNTYMHMPTHMSVHSCTHTHTHTEPHQHWYTATKISSEIFNQQAQCNTKCKNSSVVLEYIKCRIIN